MNTLFSTIAEESQNIFQWKEILVPIITGAFSAILGGGLTFLFTHSKMKSETGKIDAETLKTYLEIIKDIQDNNQSLYDKLQVLREKVDTVDDMLEQAQDDLAKTQKDLEDCLSQKI